MTTTPGIARGVAALALALALGGCTGAPPPPAAPAPSAEPQPQGRTIDERFTPDIPPELRVRDPKDIRGLDTCALLTPAQLDELGLDPDSDRRHGGAGQQCTWQYRDGSTSAGLDVVTNPRLAKLPDIYRLRDAKVVFEIRQIAGHPALRADHLTDECRLYLAVTDTQLVAISAYADARVLPDPCGPAVRMAEMVIANLAARP
ncbi:MAG: DUF3558 domain-containing protein [Pseudonocardia sp.]